MFFILLSASILPFSFAYLNNEYLLQSPDFSTLQQDLQIQSWLPKSAAKIATLSNKACAKDLEDLSSSILKIGHILLGNKNLTLNSFDQEVTLQVIDSNGIYNGGLLRGHTMFHGRFKQCRNIKFSQNRVTAWEGDLFRLFLGSRNQTTCNFSGLVIGVDECLPKSCSAEDIREVVWDTLALVCLTSNNDMVNVNKMSAASYVLLVFICVIVGVSIVAGLVDYYLFDDLKHVSFANTLYFKIFMAFSFTSNFKIIFNTKGAHKSGQINTLHCIRFLSMCWVIIGHSYYIAMPYFNNMLDIVQESRKAWFYFITNAMFSVDSFFFIGGLLLSYLWFKEFKRNRRAVMSPQGWLMFYVHRILRLSPVYYVAFFTYFLLVLPNLPDSINTLSSVPPKLDTCHKYWWRNIFYVQNVFDAFEACYSITWYLATDMQMFIFTPILLISFSVNRVLGYVVGGTLLTLSTAANIVTVVHFRYPETPLFFDKEDPKVTNFMEYTRLMYFSPWIRCQVYIIGILLGYFLHTVKSLKMPKIVAFFGFVLSLSLLLFDVMILHANSHDYVMPLGWRVIYSAFSKPLWGLCLAWIVAACFYGHGGLINSFMTLPVWIPLGKLTYCAYLIHFMVIYCLYAVHNGEFQYDSFFDSFAVYAIPSIVCTYIVAIPFSSCFEVAFGRVETILLGNPRQRGRQADEKNPTENIESNGTMEVKKEGQRISIGNKKLEPNDSPEKETPKIESF